MITREPKHPRSVDPKKVALLHTMAVHTSTRGTSTPPRASNATMQHMPHTSAPRHAALYPMHRDAAHRGHRPHLLRCAPHNPQHQIATPRRPRADALGVDRRGANTRLVGEVITTRAGRAGGEGAMSARVDDSLARHARHDHAGNN